MPKQYYMARKLPPQQPDRCEQCPLLGLIPPDERRSGLRERYYCLGVYDTQRDESGAPLTDESGKSQFAFPRLKTKGVSVSAKAVKSGGHVLHRPCDYIWNAWMTLPGRLYGMPTDVYLRYRMPYEHEQQVKAMPKFKFIHELSRVES